MNKKILLPICLLAISLSACSSSTSSLYGDFNLELDSNQINEVLLGFLDSRSHVSGAEISITHEEHEVSDTALLFSDEESSETHITYTRYSNTALGYTYNEQSVTTSGATGISYNSNVSMTGYSWLALDTSDEEENTYNHFSHEETSYNNGYNSTRTLTLGTTDSIHRLSYWSGYVIDTFYTSLISSYLDFSYSSSSGNSVSLFDTFVSNRDLYDNSSSLTFIYQGKGNDVIAYCTETEIVTRANPLYATDSSKDIATMIIKSISYSLTNDSKYGYVLSDVSVSFTYELLESFDNVYLSNPREVETYSFDLSYSYSDNLSFTSLPSVESTDASFYPILSTYQEVVSDVEDKNTKDDSSGAGEDATGAEAYDEDSATESDDISLTHYERIGGTRYTDIVNMTSYYRSEDPSFTGSAYELEISLRDVTNAYSFSTSLSVDEEEERVFNVYGYSDITTSSYSSTLLEEVTGSDTDNLFKISRSGTYSFVLLFSEEYELVSISMYVLNMD
ncbi:MAG: hypothetical protein LUC16_01850 [Coprobacillus sp.]|nr:hypothetical protein [Coprobacillus sp.]